MFNPWINPGISWYMTLNDQCNAPPTSPEHRLLQNVGPYRVISPVAPLIGNVQNSIRQSITRPCTEVDPRSLYDSIWLIPILLDFAPASKADPPCAFFFQKRLRLASAASVRHIFSRIGKWQKPQLPTLSASDCTVVVKLQVTASVMCWQRLGPKTVLCSPRRAWLGLFIPCHWMPLDRICRPCIHHEARTSTSAIRS